MPLSRDILRSKRFLTLAAVAYGASVLWINMLWFGVLFAPGTDTPPPDAGLPWIAIGLSVLFVMFTLTVFSCLVVDRYTASEGLNTGITSTLYCVTLIMDIFIGAFVFVPFRSPIDDISYFGLFYGILGLAALIPSIPVLLLRMNFTMFAPAEPDGPESASQGTKPAR